MDGMDGGEREGANLDVWEGTERAAREGTTVQCSQSVRKEQPAGGNGAFGLTFWLHRVVAHADWFLEAGTLVIFETSACCGALYSSWMH
jgi:hypothetical protein